MTLSEKVRTIIISATLLLTLLVFDRTEAGPYVELGAGINTQLFGTQKGREWDDAGGLGFYSDLGYRNAL